MAEATTREFVFSRRDFEEVRKMIYDHAGIALSDAKEDMVYSRLARRRARNRPGQLPGLPRADPLG